MHWTEGSSLAKYKQSFGRAHVLASFLFHLGINLQNADHVRRLRATSNVVLDRSVIATEAYHLIAGLHPIWLHVVPKVLTDEIDTFVYLTLAEDERRKRLESRKAGIGPIDMRSLELGPAIGHFYEVLTPADRLVSVPTDGLTKDEMVTATFRALGMERV